MATPPGYANCSLEFALVSFPRHAFITFGCNPTDTDPLLVATNVKEAAAFTGSLLDIIDSNVTMVAVHVALGTDGGEDLHGDLATSDAGRRSGASLPSNCALLVHKRTARGGRRGRGRVYLPWSLDDTIVDEIGIVPSATVTANNTKMATWLAQMTVEAVPMVLLHDEGLTAEGPPDPVTQLLVDGLIGTQRRRLGR